jgi:hypothetical protein
MQVASEKGCRMSEALAEYRDHLVMARQKAQEDYDKTVLSLSSAALGISFAFLDNIVKDTALVHAVLLFIAWGAWVISASSVLLSFGISSSALGKAIEQIDQGTIYSDKVGGKRSHLIAVLNFLSGVLFIVGLIFMAAFVFYNMR